MNRIVKANAYHNPVFDYSLSYLEPNFFIPNDAKSPFGVFRGCLSKSYLILHCKIYQLIWRRASFFYCSSLMRKRPMIFRRFARILNIVCIVLYLPVVLGGGECVALCFEQDGSLALDYTHRCGIGENSSIKENAAGIKDFFSAASYTEPYHAQACRDIPLVIGNHTHFAPEINHSLNPGRTCGKFPVLTSTYLNLITTNVKNSFFLNPLSYPSSCGTGNTSVLII